MRAGNELRHRFAGNRAHLVEVNARAGIRDLDDTHFDTVVVRQGRFEWCGTCVHANDPELLGCKSDHGGPNYERLVADSRLVLQLHRWDLAHHHGPIGDPTDLPPGNGLLLWFEVDDFDAAVARVRNAAINAANHS